VQGHARAISVRGRVRRDERREQAAGVGEGGTYELTLAKIAHSNMVPIQ
jgi:hypothetical protein